MKTPSVSLAPEVIDSEWLTFPGGELQAPRPKALCPACRKKLTEATNGRTSHLAPGTLHRTSHHGTSHQPLCFNCYRAGLQRERALKAAGELDTASEQRFQFALPLEPVDRSRLERLRVERAAVRVADQTGVGRYVDQRRRAQIAARHALERIVVGLRARNATKPDQDRAAAAALHAAELQLPEAWLPFVAVR